ncbi:unnamed protein product [Rotaria sordida]|uniref:Uncharacterized protein n=1 Tax=Rotaria sordida TaxID=392033 RepID=A0A815NPR4_9BILA|nr:unnamed protein product [Rotaria sordida]
MRQQILSCIFQTNKQIKISFSLVDFQTTVKPSNTSRLEKPIGYRLMCRFWIYDVFYHPAVRRGKNILKLGCIYNNFFVIRLKWYYESKRVKSFVDELIEDDLILREYIGDGCVHSAMLEIDSQANVQQVIYISYGHNFHLMPSGHWQMNFCSIYTFYEDINKSCQQSTVLKGVQGILTRIKMS